MAKLIWDKVGERYYETGADQCALFVMKTDGTYDAGVAWNGFRGITENRSGADETALYANNKKYLGLRAAEEFGGSISAYAYPDAWEACDGSAEAVDGVTLGQQARQPFGLVYRTYVGSDTTGSNYEYKIHLVYNATASPTNREYNSINDSPEAAEMSWDFSTTPVEVSGFRPTSHIEIDSRKADKTKMQALLDTVYGTAEKEPTLPSPDEVIEMMKAAA